MWVCTYRAHDRCLPVELSSCQYGCSLGCTAAAVSANRLSRGDSLCTKSDVPGRRRWDQHCRKREDHCVYKVSQMFLDCSATRQRRRHAQAPRVRRLSCEQTARPAVAEEKRVSTYRPRSVSSLLIRLRAMAAGFVWIVSCGLCGAVERCCAESVVGLWEK